MSELGTYTFLPWLRQGLSNEVTGTTGARATIPMDVIIKGQKVSGDGELTATVHKDVQIYGPGDIIGIDKRAIIKVEPRNSITNFEPNYLPYIEFYDEDFPWRYSPTANPNSAVPVVRNRLQPWMVLVVLKEEEFENTANNTDQPLPAIRLNSGTILPELEQSWAWAHVHVNRGLVDNEVVDGETVVKVHSTDGTEMASRLGGIIATDPDLAYSRIVSPRRLEPQAAYHAFLMPAFKSGVQSGLGQAVDVTQAAEPAWTGTDGSALTLPYYHRWYFRTGTTGDFEYLVRLLEPKPVDSRVGVRDMDVQRPGANLKGLEDPTGTPEDEKLNGFLRLGGALRIPQSSQKDLAEAQRYEYWAFRGDLPQSQITDLETSNQPLNISAANPLQENIAAFINLTDGYQTQDARTTNSSAGVNQEIEGDPDAGEYDINNNPDPLITAPLYGRWHALTQRLRESRSGAALNPNYNWVHELNLDPRWRVAAGFGTKVVQENQEDYMKAAWEQIGDVLEANRRIREAQLAQLTARIWYVQHLAAIARRSDSQWLNLAAPVHARVLSEGLTVHYQKQNSRLSMATTSTQMRKAIRPGGKLVRRLPFTEEVRPDQLIERVNAGEVSAAPPLETPEGIQTPGDVAEVAEPNRAPDFLRRWLRRHPWLRWIPLGIAVLLGLYLIFLNPGARNIVLPIILFLIYLFALLSQWVRRIDGAAGILEENQSQDAVDEMPSSSDFRISTPAEGFEPSFGGQVDSAEGARFKTALRDVNWLLETSAEAGQVKERPPLRIAEVNQAVLARLNPTVTIPAWVDASVQLPPFIVHQMKERFVEAMAYPVFDLPMYKPLVDSASELFLPNINFIDQNSISLLETNQKFIESYMVGLNHEFARELLWREYPTDQRGSSFRQFWETKSVLDVAPLTRATIRARYDDVFDKAYIAELAETYEQLKDDEFDHNEAFLREAQRRILNEELKDIKPIHYWSRRSKLGEHDNRELPGDNEEELVLVIRGELLKKYPTAVIYAHRAEWTYKEGDDGEQVIDLTKERVLKPIPPEEQENPSTDYIRAPLYEAKVDPDIYFFGFDLTICDAQGGSGEDDEPTDAPCEDIAWDDPGWFFVIKERPGEPRFGLDVPDDEVPESQVKIWNDLSWSHVTPGVAGGGYLQINSATTTIDLNTRTLTGTEQEKDTQRKEDVQIVWSEDMNAAELAYVLYQVPVLVAVHATEMLP